MIRSALRDALAWLLRASGASSWRRRRPDELLILTFHRVLPDAQRAAYPLPWLAVTPEELRWSIATLQPWFDIGTVTTQWRRQHKGDSTRPLLALSFDDGQWDNAAHAAPVLDELGVRATFYLPTDYIDGTQLLWHDRAGWAWTNAGLDGTARAALLARLGADDAPGLRPFLAAMKRVTPRERLDLVDELETRARAAVPGWARMMRWAEVKQLHSDGHEIGSHACSHALLPQLDTDAQRRELAGSRRAIETATGVAPPSLCYPNGSYDERSVALAHETGYENAVTTRWGINAASQGHMELLRCDMDAARLTDHRGRLSEARLAMRLSGLQPGLGT